MGATSLRGSEREGFRGFQRFLEVFRGFQGFSEVFQRSSQRLSQRQIFLSEVLGLVALIVLPLNLSPRVGGRGLATNSTQNTAKNAPQNLCSPAHKGT